MTETKTPTPLRPTPVAGTPPVPAAESFGGSLKDGDLRTAVPLESFLWQLGILMRLPQKRREPIVAQATRVAKRATRWALPAVAVAVVVVFGAAKLWPAAPVVVPGELQGMWRTADKKYADRSFVVTETDVVLKVGTGRSDHRTHRIVGLEVQRTGGDVVYDLQYEEDGQRTSFPIRYVAGPPEAIRFVNQPEIEWRKGIVPVAAAPAPGAAPRPGAAPK